MQRGKRPTLLTNKITDMITELERCITLVRTAKTCRQQAGTVQGTQIEYNLHAEACTWFKLAEELTDLRNSALTMAQQCEDDAAAAKNKRRGA